nr:PKD domain-containing protein [bacterium]
EMGATIDFDGSASTDEDGTIEPYNWDFGDGETAEGDKVTHTYAAAGEYTVTLTVTDDQDATGTAEIKVTITEAAVVENQPPVAVIAGGVVITVEMGASIDFDGSASTDADGTIASYNWDFGDGNVAEGDNATHTYAAAGEYTVTLTVTDDQGAPSTAEIKVTVVEEVRSTISIIFKGTISDMSGAPISGATVEIINQNFAPDKENYDPDVTDDEGNYDIRYFALEFGDIAAQTGDKLLFIVNGKERPVIVNGAEREPFVIKNEDLVSPFILNVDAILPPTKLIVTGLVLDAEFVPADDRDGLSVKVANPNKNIESILVPTQDGRYTAELAGEIAAEVDDEIIVTVSDADGNEVGGASHISTEEDLKAGSIIVNVATIFQGPIGIPKETISIIFIGVVYEADGVTPVPNATVEIINQNFDPDKKNYDSDVTDDEGKYDSRYFALEFGDIAAQTGDKILFIVNGTEEIIYTLKSRDLVEPYILTIDILRTTKEILPIEPKEPLRIYADGQNTVDIVFELIRSEYGSPITGWKDLTNIAINPLIGSVGPIIETTTGTYTATYTVGTEEAEEVIITIEAKGAPPVSLPPITLFVEIPPAVLDFDPKPTEINTDSEAPMGTIMLNAYTSTQKTTTDIDYILFEISSDGGATWEDLGTASTFSEVGTEDLVVLQQAAISSPAAKEVDIDKFRLNKWTLEWDTTTVDDTITYHPDVAPEEDEGRDSTKDENFPPGPYIVRAVTVDVNGVRQDEQDEPKSPLTADVSVDNIDDVPPLTGTQIVDIRREEDLDVFSDNLLPAEEIEVYVRIQLKAKPAAEPTTFENIVLLIESEDGTFSQEYTLDENYFVEINTWAEKIPNGRYIFQAFAIDAAGNQEVLDGTLAQKVTITNIIPPELADISLVQVAGTPIPPITLDAPADLRPVSSESLIEVAKAQAAMALMLVSTTPLMWDVPADINLNDPSIVVNINGEPVVGGGFTFPWDATPLETGQYFVSFIFRSGPPVILKELIDISTIVDNTKPEVMFLAPNAGSTLGFRPVVWVKYQGTGSEIYQVTFELQDESGNTVLTPGVAEGMIEGEGATATYVKPLLDEDGFSIDDARLVYKVPELLEAGGYTVSIIVTDLARNVTRSEISFVVGQDTSPPIIMVTSPQGTIPVSEVTLSVSAMDDTEVASVALKLDGVEIPPEDVQLVDGVATSKAIDLEAGEHQVEAVVMDPVGNKASAKWSFIVDLEMDTTPPQITVVSPQGIIRASSTKIIVSATDESGITDVAIKRNGANVPGVQLVDGVATANVTNLAVGVQQIEAVVTDGAGNKAQAAWNFTVELVEEDIDTTPPQITVASPQGTIYKDSATISATVTDESGIDGKPTIQVDGSSISVTFSDGLTTGNATGLDSGEHQVKVTVTDNAGNTASAQWSFTVMLDTIPPAITAVSPLGTVRVEKPTISVSVSDDVSGVDSIDILLEDAAGKKVSGKVSSDESSATFKPNSALKAGTYTATAEAEDVAGNSSSAQWIFTVEFDVVPPVITIVSPQDGTRMTEAKPTISASYSDNLAGVDEKSVVLKIDGQDVTGKASTKNVSQIVYTTDSDLSIGPHTVNLDVEDNDDNKASITWSFIVEAKAAGIVNPRNYPNPFGGNTTIAFKLTQQSQVTIRIFDFSGRLVKMLKDNEVMEAGPYEIPWDGKSENGDDLARGVYFGVIIMKTELEPQQAVLKMALTR